MVLEVRDLKWDITQYEHRDTTDKLRWHSMKYRDATDKLKTTKLMMHRQTSSIDAKQKRPLVVVFCHAALVSSTSKHQLK